MMKISETARENAIRNLHECREKKTTLESFPIKVYIEPTDKCNLRCTYCGVDRKNRNEMDMDLFNAIKNQLFEHCSEVNLYLNGEPTLSVNFGTMLRTCSRFSFITNVFTNFSYKNDEAIKEMVECGAWINVSFDGMKSSEQTRRGINLDLFLRNIELVHEFQDKIQNPKFHLRLGVVVSKVNAKELPEIVRWAHVMRFGEIMLSCVDTAHNNRIHMLTPEDRTYFNEAVALSDELKMRISSPSHISGARVDKSHNWNDFDLPIDEYAGRYIENLNPDVQKRFCPYPWIQTVINSKGEVFSCSQRKIVAGKMNSKTKFVSDIWNNKMYRTLRSFNDSRKCYYFTAHECVLMENSILGGGCRLDEIQ